jgi:hypothetical protein
VGFKVSLKTLMEMKIMTKALENANKLERLSAHLADNPNPDAKIQNRLLNCIEDAVDTEASDKELTMYYTYARKQAKRFGYGRYLSQGSIPTIPEALRLAFEYIDSAVAMIVPADKDHPIYEVLRRKKNKDGISAYTPETLLKTLSNQSKRWHSEAYDNGSWDGSIVAMQGYADSTNPQEDA